MGTAFTPTGETDQLRTLEVLTSAFVEDPVERWLFPTDDDYRTAFPQFLMAFGGRAFAAGTVYALDEFSAVAMWLPPGVEPDGEAILAVLTRTVSVDKHGDTFAVLEQMDAAHPTYPHWYLPWLAVRAGHQGKGLGGELLNFCLTIVDSARLPAYLESPNPRNVSFYVRHGFEVREVVRSGACPPVTLMERPVSGG
ncbi:MAG: GNAT family N-acetyltransferase [Nocardioidaceae bacterium]